MREILFRGKRIDNGEWVYGFYVPVNYAKPLIVTGADIDDYSEIEFDDYYHVNDTTVGQYTGLTDKNGKKVFDGDIIKGKFSNYVIWADENEHAFVYGKSYKSGYTNQMSDYLLKSSYPNGIEAIGNIHDNPELLEVVKK